VAANCSLEKRLHGGSCLPKLLGTAHQSAYLSRRGKADTSITKVGIGSWKLIQKNEPRKDWKIAIPAKSSENWWQGICKKKEEGCSSHCNH